MKTSICTFLILAIGFFQLSYSQKYEKNYIAHKFPFIHDNWTIENSDGSTAEIKISEHKGKQALMLEANQKAYLKAKKFKNFVMDFYCNGSAPGIGFRAIDKKNYEYLYLRVPLGNKRDALQYVPIYNGSLPWQLYNYPEYEGKAPFPKEQVGTLPLSFGNELAKGKASQKLLAALEEMGILFSTESEIGFMNGTAPYIFDPENKEVLLFEKLDNAMALMDFRTWIHTKVEVLEDKMSIFIEDMGIPAFVVENLKREPNEGGISLIGDNGPVYFSDFSITEIKSKETLEDRSIGNTVAPNYLTKWNISEMFAKDSVNLIAQIDSLSQNKPDIKTIEADEDGLINISRFYDDMTKTVALSCNIVSDSKKAVKLNFDYADHLVILLGSKVLFDKGMNFQPPPEKGEEGRVFVGDEEIELNLSKGSNRLVFVLSGDDRQKFNWGFIAKLGTLNGIAIH